MSNPTAKGGNVILRDVDLPETVAPGESVTAEVEVSNGANLVTQFDPDHCSDNELGVGGLTLAGYELRVVVVLPDGSKRKTDVRCHGTTEIGTADYTYSLTFTAPESTGDHSIQAYVELPGSGETTGRTSEYLTVTETSPESPENDDDDDSTDVGGNPFDGLIPGGGGGGSGGSGGGSGGLFGDLLGDDFQLILVLVIIIIGLGALS